LDSILLKPVNTTKLSALKKLDKNLGLFGDKFRQVTGGQKEGFCPGSLCSQKVFVCPIPNSRRYPDSPAAWSNSTVQAKQEKCMQIKKSAASG
jgi:hypothetical protein